MRDRFGVSRSAEAVRRHAYRVGIPVIVHAFCVRCGGVARTLDEDGACPACHRRRVSDEYAARSAPIKRGLRRTERDAAKADREYARLRQQEHRSRGKRRKR